MATLCKQCNGPIPDDHAQVGGVHLGACEHMYFYIKDQKMIKVRPSGERAWCIMTPIEADGFMCEMSDLEQHDYECENVMMSKGEIDVLPEFEGW